MKPNYDDVFVASQMPEYQATNNPLFVTLMQYYFQFLGQQKQTFSIAKNLRENRTIDGTLDDFLTFFASEFISKLPHNVASDKRQLMRRAIDLYQTKGTKKSVETFFRLVYNQDATVSLPRDNMLIASGSKWVQESSFRVSVSIGSLSYFDSVQTLHWSNSSGSFAIRISRARLLPNGNIECFFKKQSQFVLNAGDILTGFSTTGSIAFRATAQLTTNKIQIVSAGKNFKIGQIFYIQGTLGNSLFRVIDIGPSGELLRIQFIEYGLGMPDSDNLLINPYSSAPIQDEIDITTVGSVTTLTIRDNVQAISDLGKIYEPVPNGTIFSYFANDYLTSASGQSYFGNEKGSFDYTPSNPTNIRTKTNVTPEEYNASTATLRTSATVVNVYPGQYENIQGHISESSIKLQDSYFYQIYSYLINSSIPLGEYKKAFKEIMHPSGKIFFGNLNLDSDIDISSAIRLYLNEIYSVEVQDSISTTDSFGRLFSVSQNDSVTTSDSLVKNPTVNLVETLVSSEVIAKFYTDNISESVTTSDSVGKSTTKPVNDSATLTDTQDAANTYVDGTYFATNDYVLTQYSASVALARQNMNFSFNPNSSYVGLISI